MIIDNLNLNKQEAFVQNTIPNQLLVSNFTETEYEKIERVFTKNTGHITSLVNFVKYKIIPLINSKKSFLDIGSGPATITKPLSQFFETTSVVEPNRAYESLYQENNFTAYIANFQDIALPKNFDVVLCSHVLYHIPQHEWVSYLKKMHQTINAGGKGIVTLVAPRGKWHELRASINPEYSNSGKVEKVLKELNIPYELTAHQSVFKVENYEDFRALAHVFVIDDCYLPHEYSKLSDSEKLIIEQKIEDFITTCRQPDGSYLFVDEDDYIVMHK